VLRSTDALPPLLVFVRLSRERARQAVRQDCSFAKKQESPPALLVVVQASDIRRVSRMALLGYRDTSPGGSCGTRGAGSSGKGARMRVECPQVLPVGDDLGAE